jgi:hypothetical protein
MRSFRISERFTKTVSGLALVVALALLFWVTNFSLPLP